MLIQNIYSFVRKQTTVTQIITKGYKLVLDFTQTLI